MERLQANDQSELAALADELIDQTMGPKDGDPLSSGFVATGEIDHGDNECDYCPHFQHALELIGRRWTGSILKVIGDRSLRFGEIRSDIPGLSDRLLDTRLTELEAEGVLSRSDSNGEVRYAATAKGIALRPAFDALVKWAYEFPVNERADALPGRRRNETFDERARRHLSQE